MRGLRLRFASTSIVCFVRRHDVEIVAEETSGSLVTCTETCRRCGDLLGIHPFQREHRKEQA
jgi:hypothetical protein